MNVFKLISKNLKVLLRSKLTAFILILGPLLIILVAGLAFNNNSGYTINVGIYVENSSVLGDSFVKDLSDAFAVTQFSSKDSCIDSVKAKGFHGCVVIPFVLNLEDAQKDYLEFYFDNSRVNIVGAIRQKIFDSVDKTSEDISADLTSEFIDSVTYSENALLENEGRLNDSLQTIGSAKTTTNGSQKTLQSSPLDFNKDDLDIDEIESKANSIKNDYNKVKSVAQNSLSGFDSFVSSVDSLTNDSSVQAKIDLARTTYSNLKVDLENSTLSSNSIEALNHLLDDLSSHVNALENNINTAKNNNNQVVSNLDDISSALDSSKAKINEVKASFEEMKSVLAGNTVRDAGSVSSPVDIVEHEIVSGSKLRYLFPNLIILVMMFVTIIVSATQIINDKVNPAQQRMAMTPRSFLSDFFASFFTILIISIIQLILILPMVHLVFGIDMLASWQPILSVLLFAIIFFILLGIAIGYLFNSEHTVMIGAISVSSFFFILSDMILPLESMPVRIIEIMNFTPFILATDMLRKVMFFGSSISDINIKFYCLVGMSVGLLLIIVLSSYSCGLVKKIRARLIARKNG